MSEPRELSQRAEEAMTLTRLLVDPATDTTVLDGLVLDASAAAQAASGRVTMLIDKQVTAAIRGELAGMIERGQTDHLEDTICVNVLRTNDALVIPDTTADHRVSSLPTVVAGMVGAYLGAPLRTSSGAVVGVLCVMDDHPRLWTEHHLSEVARIAEEIVIEMRRILDSAA
jgi:GAF domain-containing protein